MQFKTIPLVFLLSPLAVAMVCHGQELKLAVTEATAGWETAGSATADSAMAALETTDWEIPEWISSEMTIAPKGGVADPPVLGVPPDVTDASMNLPPDSYSQIDYPAESITPHFGITDEEKAKASGWRFGGEFLIAEREQALPFGRQYGFRLSVDQENEWADKPTTISFIGRYLAGDENSEWTNGTVQGRGTTESSLSDAQLDYRWHNNDTEWSFYRCVGLRAFYYQENLTLHSSQTTFPLELDTRNFLLGAQLGLGGRYRFGRAFVGGHAKLGAMGNSADSDLTQGESASISFRSFAPMIDFDLHAGIRLGRATDIVIGYYALELDGVATADNVSALAASEGSSVGYKGWRTSISHRF